MLNRFVELDKVIHDRKSFDCGREELNLYLQNNALRHVKIGISRTMVLNMESDPSKITSYFTVAASSIDRKTLPKTIAKKLPHYPIPIFIIAQLAVDKISQGKGLGLITLKAALEYLVQINERMPAHSIFIDCIDDKIRQFYEGYGFEYLSTHDDRDRLYLLMETAKQAFQ